MKVSVLDDWFDTLETLACLQRLAGHDVAIWMDHVDENCSEAGGGYRDKSLGVWRYREIPQELR